MNEQRTVTRSEIRSSMKNSEPVHDILLLIYENCDVENYAPPGRDLIENDRQQHSSHPICMCNISWEG